MRCKNGTTQGIRIAFKLFLFLWLSDVIFYFFHEKCRIDNDIISCFKNKRRMKFKEIVYGFLNNFWLHFEVNQFFYTKIQLISKVVPRSVIVEFKESISTWFCCLAYFKVNVHLVFVAVEFLWTSLFSS